MSFCVVPDSDGRVDALVLGVGDVEARAATAAVALMVMEVFISPTGMPSRSSRHVAQVGHRDARPCPPRRRASGASGS